MAIIYKATFSNGKSYVGFTSKSLGERKIGHKKDSISGSEYLLHKAIRKYGFDDISWEVLIEHEDKDYALFVLEKYYIEKEGSHFTNNGYNMTFGGQAGSNLEWRQRLSEEEWEEHLEVCKENLSKTWKSEKRFDAIKKSWAGNEKRKLEASSRMRRIWGERGEGNGVIREKISQSLKTARLNGKYQNEREHLLKMSEAAKMSTKGSRWYNDGKLNYLLFDSDETTLNLKRGRIKNERLEYRDTKDERR